MTPPYGTVGHVTGGSTDVIVLVVSQSQTIPMPDIVDVVILLGQGFYQGQLKQPGDTAPVDATGKYVEWFDD